MARRKEFPMTSANAARRYGPWPHTAHREEWLSILMALLATTVATTFLWEWPDYLPRAGGFVWTLPVWFGFLYFLGQIALLLVSASQVRALGALNSAVAVAPFIAGIVALVEVGLGHLQLSAFQMTSLASLLVASLSEFLLTLWIRFVINRRTISVDSGGQS
jgi:hypothetical protein